MAEWKGCRLSEVIVSNCRSIDKNYPYSTIKYLDTGSITCGKIDGYQEYLLSKAPSRAKRLVRQNDIIYSTVRPIQRHYGFIDKPEDNLVVSTGFAVLETDIQKADPLFIYFFLTSNDIVETLDMIAEASTSTYPSLKPSDIENLDIKLPDLPEQRAISGVLSCLDRKINLLHRQNKTLESTAETLFREWFIQKADKRWAEDKVGNVLETILGGTPATAKPEYWDGDIPWINSGEINKFRILKATRNITALGLQKSNTKLLPKGTTVLAITGATLGQISLLEIEACANQSVVGIIPNQRYPKEFVFLWMKYKIGEIVLNETGGAQPHINKNDINNTMISIPDEIVMERFNQVACPIFEKITKNCFQIKNLEKTRDILLSKLMSGEIRVRY